MNNRDLHYGRIAVPMMRSGFVHLSEKTVDKEVVFEGRIITVRKDKAELEDCSVVG